MTQLQIRNLQTKTYDTSNNKMVMKSVLNTLQDLGFSVTNADADLGLIEAKRDKDVEDKTQAFFATLFAGAQARYKKEEKVVATVNVSPFGKRTKIRASFSDKVLNNNGDVMSVHDITDAKTYQKFFQEVQKGLFLQEQKVE